MYMSYNRLLICEFCGKEYSQTRKNQKFCSRACTGKYREKMVCEVPKYYAMVRGVGEWAECPVCGDKYWNRRCRPQQTCSRNCHSIFMRGENNIKYKPKVQVTCRQCGKIFEEWPCRKERRHFCSDECKYRWRSENVRGEKVYNWQGGKGFGKYCERFNFDFKERVRIFFQRKCFVCGCDEGRERHHVHHINFNPKACCDDSQREFIILCRSCHAITTNSSDRKEIARYYSVKLHEMTGGKCWFTKEDNQNIRSILGGLDKRSRWDLSHLCHGDVQRSFLGDAAYHIFNPLLPD